MAYVREDSTSKVDESKVSAAGYQQRAAYGGSLLVPDLLAGLIQEFSLPHDPDQLVVVG